MRMCRLHCYHKSAWFQESFFCVEAFKTLLSSAEGFSSEGYRKVKRTGTDSIARVGSMFISCRNNNTKHIVAVQANS